MNSSELIISMPKQKSLGQDMLENLKLQIGPYITMRPNRSGKLDNKFNA